MAPGGGQHWAPHLSPRQASDHARDLGVFPASGPQFLMMHSGHSGVSAREGGAGAAGVSPAWGWNERNLVSEIARVARSSALRQSRPWGAGAQR